MSKDVSIKIRPDSIGNYSIKFHDKCIFCNKDATHHYEKDFLLMKQINQNTDFSGTTTSTFKKVESVISIPYCEEHYKRNEQLIKFNKLYKVLIYLVPILFVIIASIISVMMGLFEKSETLGVIIILVPFFALVFGMTMLEGKIFYEKNKFNEALGLLNFSLDTLDNANHSINMRLSNEDYANEFIINNPNSKKDKMRKRK